MVKSLFKILGPIMIGPSSSHTAGAEKLGRAAFVLANGNVKSVKFVLHGSFAQTGKGHGTDKALLAGVVSISAKDERIKQAYEIAEQKGVSFEFISEDLGDVHPNTVEIYITKSDDTIIWLRGCSIGGGNILITNINGIECKLSGDYPATIIRHWDRVGVLSKITNAFEKANVNIVEIHNTREGRGGLATTIVESDTIIDDVLFQAFEAVQYVEKIQIINKL